jgi:hypothetical protein
MSTAACHTCDSLLQHSPYEAEGVHGLQGLKCLCGGDGCADNLTRRKEMMDVISDCTWKLMYSGSEIGNQIDAEVRRDE